MEIQGDILAEIETDKATMEFEAVDEGRIGKIIVPEGTEGVKVNQPIATLLGEGGQRRQCRYLRGNEVDQEGRDKCQPERCSRRTYAFGELRSDCEDSGKLSSRHPQRQFRSRLLRTLASSPHHSRKRSRHNRASILPL